MYSDSARTLFNDSWFFVSPAQSAGCSAGESPKSAQSVTLPHAWNDAGWNYEKWIPQDPAGTGWYYRTVPKNDHAGNYSIFFEGVSAECDIYLNSKQIYHNLGAYTPFTVALTDCKNDGSDLVAVKVTDKPNIPLLQPDDTDPFRISPRYKNWAVPLGSTNHAGGIWRNVWLVKSPVIQKIIPKASAATGTITIDLETSLVPVRIDCELLDGNQNVVSTASITAQAEKNRVLMTAAHFQTWHPVSPYLYSLNCKAIAHNEKILQEIIQPIAFFDFQIRNSEFYVNGRPYFLRGQNGFPHCNIPHDREYIKKYVSKIKEQGVEISRFHTEPPSHAWLDECDRRGIMVIFEMPLHGSIGCYAFGNAHFSTTVLKEMCALIIEYRRHPSIVMWSLGNELIVSSERDRNLGAPLFDILEQWITALRQLDKRPIIANSGGDAVNLVAKAVGDVDDVHQYGGWYTENLYELHNFRQFVQKNDMVFQPMLSTESVAAYTNNNGEFMIHDESDIRQRKIVSLRLGKINNLREQSLAEQSFILKEYAEAMWRLRRKDSNFGGYIPFGQYTWFFNAFDKGNDGLKEKPIWHVYRMVMGPVHVQLESWDRHIVEHSTLRGNLLICHEDISLPDNVSFTTEITLDGKTLWQQEIAVCYHDQYSSTIEIAMPRDCLVGKNRLMIQITYEDKVIAKNYLDITLYKAANSSSNKKLFLYDPLGSIEDPGTRLNDPGAIKDYSPKNAILIIGPYAYDEQAAASSDKIRDWCSSGGTVIILEQNPGCTSDTILGTGISVCRKTQPYWSRWATNMTKHADRADICDEKHPLFTGITEEDLKWWNKDTYLTHAFLTFRKDSKETARGVVLSRIGNGLLPDELMPVQYNYLDSGYSITAFEYTLGAGTLFITTLLIGTKMKFEPVARKMFLNICS